MKGKQYNMRCAEKYEEFYHRAPDDIAFCPYRVSPLGAHIDHQYGIVNGLAISKGIHMAYRAKQNGVIELHSLNFSKRAQFHVNIVPEREYDWADYLRGATKILSKKYQLNIGLSGVIEGSLPIGGLSSSASVIICFLSALCKVNNIQIDANELIRIAIATENEYVGVFCGKLDQFCEVYSKKKHLLFLDTKDDNIELIPENNSMKSYEIAIFFSGLDRSLGHSNYNSRQDECKSAAYALKAYSGMEYGVFSESRLRDVPFEVFDEYKELLPENWRKRAKHFYSEMERAKLGAKLWKNGNIEEYGGLVFESGKSSIENYECGCNELHDLFDILLHTKGIYGGRFSGAGYKGCCMALINPNYADEINKNVTDSYLKLYPGLEGKYSFHLCESADGIVYRG